MSSYLLGNICSQHSYLLGSHNMNKSTFEVAESFIHLFLITTLRHAS